MANLTEIDIDRLVDAALAARANARILGKTPVGAAVLSENGEIFAGCNVEHRYRSHDVHAEVNALTSMVSAGDSTALVVVIVSSREHFSPCGGCMDWIFELGGPQCAVVVVNKEAATMFNYTAEELMPYYPR